MFLILREPADSLATAVITYRNEGSLTRKGQQLSQEPSTSREWMLNSNNLFSARERFFKHRHHLRQRSSKALTKVQLIVETSPISISNRAQKPAPPKWAIVAVESGERVARTCEKLLQGV
ncbi:hypothetical protein K443DRAFT_361571 [Laccaria amethystina LaAM-08-1]|uniref:Uncharacterized protein n=1 Tax=Laccaria amethystina LaAM-08-1 TaxID=1095629 RepID=A0A0C9WS37_9AGAR|nr:hypothetical protein K443DRAFT_361571 [Laccaria amethystina LaAM-08-1]